ncbi:MAG: RNA polymerase sigma factor [Polyangiales bacterium]
MLATIDQDTIALMEPSLLRYATRRVGREDVARDLVQETWLAAMGSVASFAGRSSLKTWLTSILRRKIVDLHRRSRPQLPIEDQHATFEIDAAGEKQDEARAVDLVRELLPTLPPREREALELCDVEGLDRDVAAERMGVTRGALRVLLHRGRHRLREELEAQGFGG